MIRAKKVRSIEELITAVKGDYAKWKTTAFPWFRGEPADTKTPLLPKLYRKDKGIYSHNENNLLQQFRMKAPSFGYMDTPPREHVDEWLFLAQHVGLPTRLLDWTEGLLIAAYFATKEISPAIWMLNPIELNKNSVTENLDPKLVPLTWFNPQNIPATKSDLISFGQFMHMMITRKDNQPELVIKETLPNIGNYNIRGAWENDKVGTNFPVAIHPTNVHTRMNTQKSRFTIQGLNKASLAELVDATVLRKYIIPRECVETFKKDLQMIGFTHSSVFPDLDNLAKELSEVY